MKMKRQKNTKPKPKQKPKSKQKPKPKPKPKTKKKNTKYKYRDNRRITKKTGSRKRSSNMKKIMINYGGAPFAQGGFGCIFSPALKCKETERTSNSHYDNDNRDKFVSKLIETKYAKREYD